MSTLFIYIESFQGDQKARDVLKGASGKTFYHVAILEHIPFVIPFVDRVKVSIVETSFVCNHAWENSCKLATLKSQFSNLLSSATSNMQLKINIVNLTSTLTALRTTYINLTLSAYFC